MEAAARGAALAGGLVIGILPSEDESTANPYVHVPIITGLGNARNAINVLTSHAVIAVGGGYGTLSEIALALKTRTPVVGLNTWKFSIPGLEIPPTLFCEAATPEDAVEKAMNLARGRMIT